MTDLRHYDVIRTPAITEKSTLVSENNQVDRKSTRLNSSHNPASRMPSSA
jgi:hypothetical protein